VQDFSPPEIGSTVGVEVERRSGKVRFDTSDPRISIAAATGKRAGGSDGAAGRAEGPDGAGFIHLDPDSDEARRIQAAVRKALDDAGAARQGPERGTDPGATDKPARS
jgi:hypothetical protein